MTPAEKELCVKYPWLPQCRRFATDLSVKEVFRDPKYAQVVERAFERLEQALASGVVSKRKIPSIITTDEYNFHLENSINLDADAAAQSINIILSVSNGKTKVIKP